MRVLALDIGTSSVRARVVDERADPVEGAEAQIAYESSRGSGELEPDELVSAAERAIEEARGSTELDAVGVSCFWHSLLAVDRRGAPVSPLLTWRDTRAAQQADRLAARLDARAVHARTGCVLHPSYWPAKLAWMREVHPDAFERAERFLSFPDYLFQRLHGEVRTSLSMASATGLLDLNARVWDAELLDALSIAPEWLAEISDEPLGDGEPWFPAYGDGACSNLGAGCTSATRAGLMVGTSAAYRVVYEPPERAEPRERLFLYRVDERRVVEGGALSDGGNLYAWLEQTLAPLGDEQLAEREPGGHGLTFLALFGGERSPGWNPRVRGAIAGLTLETTAADLAQAALEGVACRLAEVADLMPEVESVVATGHALLANADWTQIVADVVGRPLEVSAVDEASARGAAVLALERLGVQVEPPPISHVVEPRPERHETYRVLRENQRQLYEGVT